jgi:formate dehydrogenase gamma subunit
VAIFNIRIGRTALPGLASLRLTAVLAILSAGPLLLSQENEDCLMCHADPGLNMFRNGEEVSLFVHETEFMRSVHAGFQCVDCHAGFDPFEIPHADPIERVDCAMCHATPSFEKSIHAEALQAGNPDGPKCYDCHTSHAVRPAAEQRNNTASCLSCHATGDVAAFSRSAHAMTRPDGSVNASCVDCHGGHEVFRVTSPSSAVHTDTIQETCGVCHGDVKAIEETSIHGQFFREGHPAAPSCGDCHHSHDVSMDRFVREQETCLSCHLSDEFTGYFGERSRQFMDQYEHSIHYLAIEEGKTSASCSDCHGAHNVFPAEDVRSTVNRSRINTTCAKCHGGAFAELRRSNHGEAFARGVQSAPVCTDCHGEHTITAITVDDSPVHKQREAETCLSCHLDNPEVRAMVRVSAGFVASYSQSIHGLALQAGNLESATCSNCHGGHEILDPDHPNSKIHRRNVNQTCGECHGEVYREYMESSHGAAFQRGARDAPTCTDCHGEHTILAHDDPRAPVSAVRLATDVCAPCHESVRLTERYGLSAGRVASFVDSYHGVAMRAGGTNVANCASCHGAHRILPSSDPRSKIHVDNIAETCGGCHPGATANFARGRIHYVGDPDESPWIHFISSLYIVLIVTIVGGMFIHNSFDFYRKSKNKLLQRRQGLDHTYSGRGLYMRMTLSERMQHGSLMISFPLLVITGFMLSYPDAFWVIPFRDHVPWFYELRSYLHRIAGVVMIAGSAYHLYHITATQRGRELIRDLMPKLQDVRDAVGVMKYNTGFSKTKPKFGRFGYVEKAEYWALVWGTALMVATGFVLWFETYFINLTSLTFHDVMRLIHFYEAWLAALSILIWHLYFVIFNPDVYPMNLAWLKGTITEEEMAHEHPLELEKIKRDQALEKSGTEFVTLYEQDYVPHEREEQGPDPKKNKNSK